MAMAKKVLIVEDYKEFRVMVKNYLETQNLDFQISEADSGEMGILAAVKEKPDIVLMDIRLPDMNGLEAASEIKKRIPECEIIILTMFETEAFRSVFKSNHISAYIGKSELYDKLIPQMKAILNNREIEKETHG